MSKSLTSSPKTPSTLLRAMLPPLPLPVYFSPSGDNLRLYLISSILLTPLSTPHPEKPLVSMKSLPMIHFSGIPLGPRRQQTGAAGTNTLFFLNHRDIQNIPSDRTITYARVVVDYRPQKEDPNRVSITVGGNLIDYPGELTTRTADLVTSKILWNSIISTPNARYLTADLKLFYLTAPLDRYEYMRIPLKIIPTDQYNLRDKAKNGFAGILANKLLKQRLAKYGYYEVVHTPGLWKNLTRPISFTLVVDDFSIKYVGKEHADHLLNALKQHYTLDIDWTDSLYCGIALKWDYHNKIVDIAMPGYIKKVLQRFQHECSKPQHSPYQCAPKQYGKAAQLPPPPDDSPPLDKPGVTRIQQIVGAILYYARCVDITILMTLSTIAHEQARATERTNLSVTQLLDYCATHPDATIRFHASDMVLNIHSNASYLNAPSAPSRIGGHFFLGWAPCDHLPIKLNGAIHVISTILKFVAASAAEAELGALFKVASFDSFFTNSATPNRPLPSIATTLPQPALPTTLLNANAPVPWRCVTSGLLTKLPANSSVSIGIPALRTWVTITPSITQRRTTNASAHTTSLSQPAHWNSHGHLRRKSCEGVLKSHSLPQDRP
eukprot:CCRYP_013232-RA/>CCRYP_013232-RA protein AED:0.30 eAED:0.25 QI:0/0/0/1/0/0/3/0/606